MDIVLARMPLMLSLMSLGKIHGNISLNRPQSAAVVRAAIARAAMARAAIARAAIQWIYAVNIRMHKVFELISW